MGIKLLVYHGSRHGSRCVKPSSSEDRKDHRLYRATPPGRDTGKGYNYRFLIILFLTACFTSVLVCITNSYYVQGSCCLLACVWQCSFFKITDKLLPFDLSILILDKLCIYTVFNDNVFIIMFL